MSDLIQNTTLCYLCVGLAWACWLGLGYFAGDDYASLRTRLVLPAWLAAVVVAAVLAVLLAGHALFWPWSVAGFRRYVRDKRG